MWTSWLLARLHALVKHHAPAEYGGFVGSVPAMTHQSDGDPPDEWLRELVAWSCVD
jgi:hypothetical protein